MKATSPVTIFIEQCLCKRKKDRERERERARMCEEYREADRGEKRKKKIVMKEEKSGQTIIGKKIFILL